MENKHELFHRNPLFEREQKMKRIKMLTIILLSISTPSLSEPNPEIRQKANNLIINIEGIRSPKGQFLIRLCSKSEYISGGKCSFSKASPAIGKSQSVKLSDIPNGIYAVKTFHDVNGNNKLDSNMLGLPNEPIAFSNNAKPNFGLPKFEHAAFTIDKDTIINLRLK